MTCDEAQEALSALLDGEEPSRPADAVDAHLLHCVICRGWHHESMALSRRLRLAVAPPVPDLTRAVLAAVAVDRRSRMWHDLPATRVALALIAVAQVMFAVPALLGQEHQESVHLARELGSFQLALAIGFMTAALRPHRAAGLAPLTGGVAALLMLTAGLDVVQHHTDVLDELPHLLAVAGSVLLWRIGAGSSGRGVMWRGLTGRLAVGRFAESVGQLVHPPRPPRRHPGTARRVAAFALVCGVLTGTAVLGAVPADAHATLSSSTPSAGTVVATAPDQVLLTFDEPVTTLLDAIRVLDASGQRVDRGGTHHLGGAGEKVAVDLQAGLSRGSYLVDWRVVSADSHPIRGTYTFSVKTAGAVATASADTSSPVVGFLLGVTRAATFAGLMLLLGGGLFLVLCWADGLRRSTVWRLLWLGWAAGVLGAVGGLLLEGPYAAAEPLSQALSWGLFTTVATTPYGHALLLQLAVLLGAGGLLYVVNRRGVRGIEALLVGAGLGTAYVLGVALAGHAGAGTQEGLALLADVGHLTAMSAWVGGLVFLSVALLPTRHLGDLSVAVPRFSRIAFGSVVLLVATGSYQAWREVGSLDAALGTPYGQILLVKLVFVGLLVGLGAISRSWVRRHYSLPVVHAWVDAPTTESEPLNEAPSAAWQLRGFRRSVVAEVAVAAVVLAVTAVLVAAEPARSAYRPATAATVQAGPVQVQVSVVPTGTRQLEVHAYVFDASGAPVAVPELRADLSLPSQDLGPLALNLHSTGPGHFTADSVSVPIAGQWTLTIRVRTTDVDEYSASMPLTVR